MSDDKEKKEKKKDLEVVTGNGKNLEISPVYDHIKMDKHNDSKQDKEEIVVPKSKRKNN